MQPEIISAVHSLLDNPDSRVITLCRPVVETTKPGDLVQSFEPKDTMYLIFAIGPIDYELEDKILALLSEHSDKEKEDPNETESLLF